MAKIGQQRAITYGNSIKGLLSLMVSYPTPPVQVFDRRAVAVDVFDNVLTVVNEIG